MNPARHTSTLQARVAASPRRRWFALAVVASGMWLSVLNISIVNIALPDMARELGVELSSVTWIVTGFLVTQATLLPIAGRAGDLYGRRRVFVAGTVILVVASILCALAWNFGSLVAFRILQAVGASAMAPTAYSYVEELFAPHERGRAMGVLGGAIGLAPVVALNIAGGLVGAFGWRSVFWFSPVVGAIVLTGAALVLPPVPASGRRQRFDVPGAVLAASGLVAILLALSRGDDWGFASSRTLIVASGGIVLLAMFVARERRTADPLLDLGLFRLRSLVTANAASAIAAAALFGVTILLPFYMTRVLGYGPVAVGLAITPVALSFVVVSPISGRFINRLGPALLASAGYGIAALGCVAMALAVVGEGYAAVLPGLVLFGVGLAAAQSPITMTAISDVPADRLGVASALPNISRYTGGAFGTALLGVIVNASIPDGAERGAGRAAPPLRDAIAEGLRTAFVVAAAFLALGALVATRMPRPRFVPAAAPVVE